MSQHVDAQRFVHRADGLTDVDVRSLDARRTGDGAEIVGVTEAAGGRRFVVGL